MTDLSPQQRWQKNNPERVRANVKRWQRKNRPQLRAYAKAWRKTWAPEYREKVLAAQRAAAFKRRYDLTQEQYEVMLQNQDGHCALCPSTPSQERYNRLNVDHDHQTDRLRGLLCTPCNHALGILGDNEEGLVKALAYVNG